MKTRIITLIALLLSISAYAQQTFDFSVGNGRTAKIHIPANLKDNAPLLITMHGFNQDATYQMNNTQWNKFSDENGFVVVYAQGEGNSWDIGGDKDVNYIKTIIKLVATKYKINKNRVYASGFSMGGMMTYHLMTKMPDQIAAFGPVSGFPVDNRNPSGKKHVPFIHHHGSADDVVKFGGDPYHAAGGYPPATDYVTRWIKWNGCDMSNPKIVKQGNDTKTIYRNEEEGFANVYTVIDGAGHWHSDNTWGAGTYTTKEIWDFVKRYSLDHDVSFALIRPLPAQSATTVIPVSTTFKLAMNEPVFTEGITAVLEGNGQTVNLTCLNTTPTTKILQFVIPEGAEINGGVYTLKVDKVKMVEDYITGNLTLTYNIEPTANSIKTAVSANTTSTAYTLSGTKATAATKGIVISKGKKVIK